MKENQKRKLKKAWLITINITSWLTTISGALMILTTLKYLIIYIFFGILAIIQCIQ
jgi:hypothetical protein